MVTTIHTTQDKTRTEDDRAGEVVSLFYVVPDDQLVPDLHPHLGAFRRGEHVFATGYLHRAARSTVPDLPVAPGPGRADTRRDPRREWRIGRRRSPGTASTSPHGAPARPATDPCSRSPRSTSTASCVADDGTSPRGWSTRPRSGPDSANAPSGGRHEPVDRRFTTTGRTRR